MMHGKGVLRAESSLCDSAIQPALVLVVMAAGCAFGVSRTTWSSVLRAQCLRGSPTQTSTSSTRPTIASTLTGRLLWQRETGG